MYNLAPIDKGIEMVNKKGRKSKYPFCDMDIGDSVFFKDKTSLDKETVYAYNYGRKSNKRFSAKSVDGGVRIWRTE